MKTDCKWEEREERDDNGDDQNRNNALFRHDVFKTNNHRVPTPSISRSWQNQQSGLRLIMAMLGSNARDDTLCFLRVPIGDRP